jgi:hypothetical protein
MMASCGCDCCSLCSRNGEIQSIQRWTGLGEEEARKERENSIRIRAQSCFVLLFGPDLRMVSSCELAPVDWRTGECGRVGVGQLRSVKAQANSDAPNDIGSRCCSSVALL